MSKKYAAVSSTLTLLGAVCACDTETIEPVSINNPTQNTEIPSSPISAQEVEESFPVANHEIGNLQFQIRQLEERCERLSSTNAYQRQRLSSAMRQLREANEEHQKLVDEFIRSLEDPSYNGDEYRCPIKITNTNHDGPYLQDRLELELKAENTEAEALVYQITWQSLSGRDSIVSHDWHRIELDEEGMARITITREDLPTAGTPELLTGIYEIRVVAEGSENCTTELGRTPLPAEYRFVHISETD